MKARETYTEKPIAGWFNGCNSAKSRFLLPDSQYVWGVNVSCRGGIPQTRPGKFLTLTLPAGNLQGFELFKPTKDGSIVGECMVFAVDGKVYYAPFPLTQPKSWEPYRLQNIQFSPSAKMVHFCDTQKSVSSSINNTLSTVATYSVLIMQDGVTASAFFDGVVSRHCIEGEPGFETVKGTWMAWSGNRLWVAVGPLLKASDLNDPLSFKERATGNTAGDNKFLEDISGLGLTSGDNRTSNLAVFTVRNMSIVQSSILDREAWNTTRDFQALLFPDLGCIAGRSIINFAGLLWWYSSNGMVSMDSAQVSYLSSAIKYRDIEMATSKRNFAPDMTGICGATFENHLLMSVPSGDTLNAHTLVLDSAIANELYLTGYVATPPAWNGVWTGTRPVQWAVGVAEGRKRIFEASIDYQALSDGSFNHIWENFQVDRTDSYYVTDAGGVQRLVQTPVYCEFETKLLGDGMDLKYFRYAEADLCEIGGTVNLKISYMGTRGRYTSILSKQMHADLSASRTSSQDAQTLYDRQGPFKTQSRRIRTETVQDSDPANTCGVESTYPSNKDKAFSLLFQWCGRMGIEAMRLYTEPAAEEPAGACESDETGVNIVTEDGTSFQFEANAN